MNEKIKTDYLKFILHKTNADLTRYNINTSDRELVNELFGRIISSDNLLRELYILSQIKELNNIGKYFIFILKKIEDNVINYDNLSQNLNADVEFIENEILNYLSNPELRDMPEIRYDKSSHEIEFKESGEAKETSDENFKTSSSNYEDDSNDEADITNFKESFLDKKSYLELIQSEEDNNENVFELPEANTKKSHQESELAFELPDKEMEEDDTKVLNEDNISEGKIEETVEEAAKEEIEEAAKETAGESSEAALKESVKDKIGIEQQDTFRIKGKLIRDEPLDEKDNLSEQTLFDKKEMQTEKVPENSEEIEKDSDTIVSESEKISLSDEIQKEIVTYENEQENQTEEENIFEEETVEEQPANALFLEYEKQVKDQNLYLNSEFDSMINILGEKATGDAERNRIIKNILEVSTNLEKVSRSMSLEIISNVYQTVTLSFQKISDGKYDITQSTLNLFKNGLSLVNSLIKGDDYFGYKDILKSIENIRNALIEEREKRQQYLKQKQEKLELERKLSHEYPDDSRRIKVTLIKKLIKGTEVNFNFLENISGEYQIYESLRSLSGNLTNFKEIVKLSKELQLKKLVQLSEASYIFLKFLQNYRINPVTPEIKEIFEYIIYNLKSLVIGKEIKDIDLFISYLNDPVKIFSKTEKKK